MAGGKRSRQEPGSSSSGKSDARFLNAEDKAAYARYKEAGITFSTIINPATLSYPVMDLFAHTSLCFLLILACPFNIELLYQFFASLRINSTYTSLQSYVGKRPVKITYQDFENILHLSTTGDKLHTFVSDPDFNWTPVNQFLRNTAAPFHNDFTSGLGKDARTIQHVLRSLVIPKAGDRIHITPLLSLTTFYIMAHREFNASDLIIRYFENLTTIRDPRHHRKPNLALGHLVSYILTTKYNLEFPSTSASPTHHPTFFSNNSLHILHNTRLHPEQGEAGEEAEENQPEQAPPPVPAPEPLRQHSQIDKLVERFDAFETRFDTFETQHQQFQTNMYEYISQQKQYQNRMTAYVDQQQQQRIQDRAWFAEQFDILQRYNPPPPPPPPGSSLSSTSAIGLREKEGELGREEEACEGEFVRVFTKVAPSKGSVRRLRSSSRIFEDLGGVYISEKKRFSAGFRWKQKELRFSAGFRWKRKEFGFSASPGWWKERLVRASPPCCGSKRRDTCV
ncbi:hypothetical protein M5K25_001776 [Dendrobium thyrsiflorum]|uniref:Uncharacterized protein n=1 Tax=Dendrobium thyrsiflorum TaxID=117978 RepID=A0ABD0W125_DENTH